jgi:hypothetical protein
VKHVWKKYGADLLGLGVLVALLWVLYRAATTAVAPGDTVLNLAATNNLTYPGRGVVTK